MSRHFSFGLISHCLAMLNAVFIALHRVVAIDMRGYGDSDKPSHISKYKMEKLVKDVKQIITALGKKKNFQRKDIKAPR